MVFKERSWGLSLEGFFTQKFSELLFRFERNYAIIHVVAFLFC